MATLIKDKIYTNSELSVYFSRCINIRHKVFEFESALKEKYQTPPLMTPVGDEIEPEIPRMAFNSKLGHSQINVSQVNASLNVRYDKEYNNDYAKCESYLIERLKLIYPIVEKVTGNNVCYCGVINKIQYSVDKKDEDNLLDIMAQKFLCKDGYDKKLYDLNLKYAFRINNTNYINLTISNFRNYIFSSPMPQKPVPLPTNKANNIGIQVLLDVNDRCAYNEISGYKTTFDNIISLLATAKDLITNKLDKILETGKIAI